MSPRTFCFACVAALAIASPTLAQSWEITRGEDFLSGEDYLRGGITSGADGFSVTCVAGEPHPTYSFTTENFVASPGMRPVEMLLDIDGQEFVWIAGADAVSGGYLMYGETMNTADIVTINTRMMNGRQMTVSIPSFDVAATFPLTGSSRVLRDVLGFCG